MKNVFLPLMITLLFSCHNLDNGYKTFDFYKLGDSLNKVTLKEKSSHLKFPWDQGVKVNTQEELISIEFLSKNGFTMKADLSYRYKAVENKIAYSHVYLSDSIINPEIHSITKEIMGQYLAEEFYSMAREEIENEIYEKTKVSLANQNILLDAILIREITLPKTLQDAIEKKLKNEK